MDIQEDATAKKLVSKRATQKKKACKRHYERKRRSATEAQTEHTRLHLRPDDSASSSSLNTHPHNRHQLWLLVNLEKAYNITDDDSGCTYARILRDVLRDNDAVPAALSFLFSIPESPVSAFADRVHALARRQAPARNFERFSDAALFEVTEFNYASRRHMLLAALLAWGMDNPDAPMVKKHHPRYRKLMYHLSCAHGELWYVYADYAHRYVKDEDVPTVPSVDGPWRQPAPDGGVRYPVPCESSIPYVMGIDVLFTADDQQLKRSPVLHYNLKGMPRKSQGRMMQNVIIPPMEHDPEYRFYVLRVLMCTLLGNYTKCAKKTCVDSQLALYALYHTATQGSQTNHWNFFKWLFVIEPKLATRSIQQYLAYRLGGSEALMEHCATLFDVKTYRKLAFQTGALLVDAIDRCGDTLFQPDDELLDEDYDAMKSAIQTAVTTLDQNFLSINYVKPTKLFMPALRVRRSKNQTFLNFETVTYAQAAFLDELVERLTEENGGSLGYGKAEQEFFYFLEALGGTEKSTAELSNLAYNIDRGKQDLKPLTAYSKRYPHSWELAQYFSFAWKRATDLRFYDLPVNMDEYQLDAIRHRLRLEKGAEIPQGGTHIKICRVCKRICSYVRDWKTDHSQSDDSGFEVTSTDLTYALRRDEKGQLLASKRDEVPIFCNGTTEYHGMKCRQQVLESHQLFGRLLLYGPRKMIMICPQPHCGVPSVIDTQRSVFTKYGWSCVECTACLTEPTQEKKETSSRPRAKYERKTRARTVGTIFPGTKVICDVCLKEMRPSAKFTEEKEMKLIVCRKHATRAEVWRQADRFKLTQIERKECVEAGACVCNDLKSTCTGKWNKASVVKLWQQQEGMRTINRGVGNLKRGMKTAPKTRPKKTRKSNGKWA